MFSFLLYLDFNVFFEVLEALHCHRRRDPIILQTIAQQLPCVIVDLSTSFDLLLFGITPAFLLVLPLLPRCHHAPLFYRQCV